MAKKKMTKEQIDKLIDEEVKQRIDNDRKHKASIARPNFAMKVLAEAIKECRWGYLNDGFVFDLYRYFINHPELTDEQKDEVENCFAEDLIFLCTRLPVGYDVSKKLKRDR